MARGFIKGVIYGGSVGLSAVAVVSVLEGHGVLGAGPEVVNQAPPSGPSAPVGQTSDSVTRDAHDMSVPEPDTLATLLPDSLAPAAVPVAGAADHLGPAPDLGRDGGAMPPPTVNATERMSSGDAMPALPDVAAAPGLLEVGVQAQPQMTAPQNQAVDAPAAVITGKADATEVAAQTQVLVAPPVLAPSTSISSGPLQPRAPELPTQTSAFSKVEPKAQGARSTGDAVSAERDAASADLSDAAVQTEPSEGDVNQPDPLDLTSIVVATPVQPVVRDVTADSPSIVPLDAPEADQTGAVALNVPQAEPEMDVEGESTSTRVVAAQSVQSVVSPVAAAERTAPGIAPLPPAPNEAVSTVLSALAQPDAGTVGSDLQSLPTSDAERPEKTSDISGAELRQIDRFAMAFDNPEDKPLMAIVLMDGGGDLDSPTFGIAKLEALGFPVSIAVDPALPDATDRMTAYREAGFEVLGAINLPVAATIAQVEAQMMGAFKAVPEAVALLDSGSTGLSFPGTNRQIGNKLAQTGHGYVTRKKNGSAERLSDRAGEVPTALIFRDVDAKDQSTTAIDRFLDHAALRATQQEAVILLGRMRPETIAALARWSSQDRASSVVMAPISAVLRAD